MKPHIADFDSLDYSHTRQIRGIDPTRPLIARARGVATLSFADTNRAHVRTFLPKTLYCPALGARLFSVRAALEDNCAVILHKPRNGIAGSLTLRTGQHIPILIRDGVLVIKPIQSGFDSAECAVAYPANSQLPHGDEFSKPFAALHFAKLLLHLRLFHASERRMTKTINATTGSSPIHNSEKLDTCTACLDGGMHHAPVPKSREKSHTRNPTNRLLHSDWWGPYPNLGSNKERFLQVFIDDESGYVWAFASRSKDCGRNNLQRVQADIREMFPTDTRVKVSVVQSDSDAVYKAGTFAEWCDSEGIIRRFSAPYTPQQNGRAERFWRTMENSVASMFCYSGMAIHFWPHAVASFVAAHNRTVPSNGTLTPIQLLTNREPDISELRVWGCPVRAFLESREHAKFTAKCRPGLNLGPDPSTKDGHFVYFPSSRMIHTTRHIAFDELWRERASHYQRLQTKFPTLTIHPEPVDPDSPVVSDQPHSQPNTEIDPGLIIPDTPSPTPPRSPLVTPPNSMNSAARRNTPGTTESISSRTRAGNVTQRDLFTIPEVDLEPIPDDFSSPFATTNRGEYAVIYDAAGIPADGPNANIEDRRSTPITSENASDDIYAIERISLQESSNSRYVTHWAPSYNITDSAIQHLISDRNYSVQNRRRSVYNTNNFDVQWRPTHEARSAFLDARGKELPIFTKFMKENPAKPRGMSTCRARLFYSHDSCKPTYLGIVLV